MLAPLLALALPGCGSIATPVDREPIAAWTQFGPNGRIELRAIVDGQDCPVVEIDAAPARLKPRAMATVGGEASSANAAFRPEFPVTACELGVSADSVRTVRLGGKALPIAVPEPKRIVVVGDTGCRIKRAADGKGDPIQDCADPAAWPWPRIAAAAARTAPDLVIHVGDFHYREFCKDPAHCASLAPRGIAVGYGWAGWQADFFTPAAPLLAAAPWVMVRGNHENCDRAGEGWMRFLSPQPYAECPDQRYRTATRTTLPGNLTAPAYWVEAGAVSLVVVDNAGHEDYRRAGFNVDDAATFGRTLAALRDAPASKPVWMLSHRPVWYDLLADSSQPNDFQMAMKQGAGDRLQLAFSGHQHGFSSINFASRADPAHYPTGRPVQVIAGGGGTQLEALDPDSPFFEGRSGPGSRERALPDGRLYDGVAAVSGIVLNRYGFLVLDRAGQGWDVQVVDPDGQAITRCRLDDGQKELACPFPGR